jgi:hypothetical protein
LPSTSRTFGAVVPGTGRVGWRCEISQLRAERRSNETDEEVLVMTAVVLVVAIFGGAVLAHVAQHFGL